MSSPAWYQANRDRLLARAKARQLVRTAEKRAYDAARYAVRRLGVVVVHYPYRAQVARQNANRRFGEKVAADVWFAVWSGVCFGCGKSPAEGVDHIVPKKRGGRNVPENLQPACFPCNNAKRAA